MQSSYVITVILVIAGATVVLAGIYVFERIRHSDSGGAGRSPEMLAAGGTASLVAGESIELDGFQYKMLTFDRILADTRCPLPCSDPDRGDRGFARIRVILSRDETEFSGEEFVLTIPEQPEAPDDAVPPTRHNSITLDANRSLVFSTLSPYPKREENDERRYRAEFTVTDTAHVEEAER